MEKFTAAYYSDAEKMTYLVTADAYGNVVTNYQERCVAEIDATSLNCDFLFLNRKISLPPQIKTNPMIKYYAKDEIQETDILGSLRKLIAEYETEILCTDNSETSFTEDSSSILCTDSILCKHLKKTLTAY